MDFFSSLNFLRKYKNCVHATPSEWTTALDDDEGKNIRNKGIVKKIYKNFHLPLALKLIALNAIDYNGNLWPHTQLLTAINSATEQKVMLGYSLLMESISSTS
jgi:hypothetical protein